MSNSCRGKAVLLTVYVEKPRRRSYSSNKNHHHLHRHHHVYHHHYLHQNNRHVAAAGIEGGSEGYNRRAQLLQYSQHLRHHSAASTNHPPQTNQIFAVKRKPKYGGTPTCLGNWKFSVQSVFRSLSSLQPQRKTKKKTQRGSTSNKIKAVMKSLEMPRKKGFLSRLFASIRKSR